LFVVCLLVAAAYCQIGGSHGPCSAVAIPGPFTEPISLFGTNSGATATAIDCENEGLTGPTTWYSLTPSSGSQVTVSTCASYTNFDTVVLVYSGNCEALTCVTSADDSDSCQINSSYGQAHFVSSGDIYYVAVTGYAGATGQYELTFSEIAANASSTCATAIAIPGPYVTPVTIYGNTEHSGGYSGSCGFSGSSHIDWYILTPHPGSQVEVSTCNSVTNYDTRLSILTGSCSSLSCVAENDDNCTTNGNASYLAFVATPSIPRYYLAVFGYGSAYGNYEVRIVEHPAQSTPGGDCGTALPLPFIPGATNLYFGSTENSLVSTSVACTSINSKSLWYRLDVPASYSGTISASTCTQQTNFDTILLVYTGSCDSLHCTTFNDDSCSTYSYASSVSWTVGSGSTRDSLATPTTGATPQSRSVTPTRHTATSAIHTLSPVPTFMPTPSRTLSAVAGTRAYFIQVAGYNSNAGPFGLSVHIQ